MKDIAAVSVWGGEWACRLRVIAWQARCPPAHREDVCATI
jgi:hypothetical protein